MRRIITSAALAALLLVASAACATDETPTTSASTTGGAAGKVISVVTSTTQLTDFAKEIGGSRVKVYGVLKANVDPHDYETPGAEAIHRRVVRRVEPGSIVLLHDDRKALDQTAVAVEWIVRDLGERGFELVTISELLGLR